MCSSFCESLQIQRKKKKQILVDLSFSAYWRFISQRQEREKGVFTTNLISKSRAIYHIPYRQIEVRVR